MQSLLEYGAENDLLPPQREIAKKLGVSRSAIQHALTHLRYNGQILVKERAGTIANSKFDINMLDLESTSGELKDYPIAIKHLGTDVITAENKNFFFSPQTTKLVAIRRLRCYREQPMTYEIAYFDEAQFPGLNKIDFNNRSLYQFIAEHYGMAPEYGRENISCVLANEELSAIFRVAPKMPLYQIDSYSYLEDDIPFEYTRQYLLGSSFKYHFIANNIFDYREE